MLKPITHDAIYKSIDAGLYSTIPKSALHVFECLDSTQAYIKEVGQVKPSLVVAETQTLGKGRFSRQWNSSGQNILMSCSWQFDEAPNSLSALGLALIVELAEILKEDYSLPVSIKWPNDLLIDGKKAAGILIDVESGVTCNLYVGIGLNVEKAKGDDIDQPWADMASYGAKGVDRNALIAGLFSKWCHLFTTYTESGFSGYQKRWNALSEHINKNVELSKNGELIYKGIMKGVDDQGFLMIESNNEILKIMDSECSLRVF